MMNNKKTGKITLVLNVLTIVVFMAGYLGMCWYLFAVCDLAYINF